MGNVARDLQIGQQAILDGVVVTIVGQPGSANHTPAARGHHCPLGSDCHRYDIDGDGAPWFAWACQLRPRIAEGAHLDCQAGDVVVRVSCARTDAAYHVQLGHIGAAIPGYGDQFDTEASFVGEVEARDYARQLVIGLREVASMDVVPAQTDRPSPTERRPGQALDDLVTAHAATRTVQPVRLAPPARGTHLTMTPAQARAIVTAKDGYVRRGPAGEDGTAKTPMLTAMAKRGWVILDVELDGRRKVVVGATVTPAGARRATTVIETRTIVVLDPCRRGR